MLQKTPHITTIPGHAAIVAQHASHKCPPPIPPGAPPPTGGGQGGGGSCSQTICNHLSGSGSGSGQSGARQGSGTTCFTISVPC